MSHLMTALCSRECLLDASRAAGRSAPCTASALRRSTSPDSTEAKSWGRRGAGQAQWEGGWGTGEREQGLGKKEGGGGREGRAF